MSGRLLIVRVQLRQTELAAARRIMKFLWIVGWWDEDAILDVSQLFFLILVYGALAPLLVLAPALGWAPGPHFFFLPASIMM